MRLGLIPLALIAAAAPPAIAGELRPAVDFWAVPAGLPPPADSGKPRLFVPPETRAPGEPERCLPPLPCGSRLLGTVRKDGAVELRVPALSW